MAQMKWVERLRQQPTGSTKIAAETVVGARCGRFKRYRRKGESTPEYKSGEGDMHKGQPRERRCADCAYAEREEWLPHGMGGPRFALICWSRMRQLIC